MSGCFGSHDFDRHLARQVDRYCEEGGMKMATGKWKWVPDQPTEAMWQAGKEADAHHGDSYTAVYCAMIEAAPEAPGEQSNDLLNTTERR